MNERQRAVLEIGDVLHRLIYNDLAEGVADNYLIGVAEEAVQLAVNWKDKTDTLVRLERGETEDDTAAHEPPWKEKGES